MRYYLAPMEGITTYIYRSAYARYFGHVDKYFTPFIAGKKMTAREVRDILPENNTGITVVPQILTNRVDDFLAIAGKLATYGYQTVNLNLGCPSGTVTAKKRGSGFLSVPDELDAFLYEIYEKCPLRISIKTRLGITDLSEWETLLDIYAKYPLEELIIHTRLQKEYYAGKTHPEAFALAQSRLRGNTLQQTTNTATADNNDAAVSPDYSNTLCLCYNGDIVSTKGLRALTLELDSLGAEAPDAVMLGRGIIRNPGLAGQLKAQENAAGNVAPISNDYHADIETDVCHLTTDKNDTCVKSISAHETDTDVRTVFTCKTNADVNNTKQLWLDFHNEILEGYRQIMSGDLPTLFKMKDLWTYMSQSFTNSEKYLKKIRKAERIPDYMIAVNALFREQDIITLNKSSL